MKKFISMKKFFLVIMGLILLAMVFVDSSLQKKIILDPDYVDFITKEQFELKGHISILREYDTNASVAYLNKNGTKTLYVFANPIRY